jgi:hypothetical protein
MATILTAQQIIERNRAVATVEAKAAREPENLTIEEVNILPGEVSSRLMAEGHLKHLGIGQPKSSWKRRP